MQQDKKQRSIAALLLLGSAVAMIFLLPFVFSLFNSQQEYYGLYVNRTATDFTLVDTSGKTVSLDDFSGHYVYMMFGFTQCRDVCPPQIGNIVAMKNYVGKRPVQFVFISIDPDRDTPEILKRYFENHGDNFIALKPDTFQASQALAMAYNEYAYIKGAKNQNYDINHNGYIFLLNPEGILKLIYTTTQLNHFKMLEDLNHLIKLHESEVDNERAS